MCLRVRLRRQREKVAQGDAEPIGLVRLVAASSAARAAPGRRSRAVQDAALPLEALASMLAASL